MSLIDCCCSGGPCYREKWFVNVCATAHATDASVTSTDGTTTITATLVVDQYELDFPNAGSWTTTFSRPGFVTQTMTYTVACSRTPVPRVVSLTLDTGYSCVRDLCCPQPGPPYIPRVWPTTLYLNDGFGIITMSGGGPTAGWTGCATRTAAQAFDCSLTIPAGLGGTDYQYGKVVSGVGVPVYFTIACNNLTVRFALCKTPADASPHAFLTNTCIDGFASIGAGNCNGGFNPGLPAVESCPTPTNTCGSGGTPGYLDSPAGPALIAMSGTNTSACPSAITVAVSTTIGAHFWLDGSPATTNEPCGNANPGYAAYQVYGATPSFSWTT